MHSQDPPSSLSQAASRRPTLEDRLLKYIEAHNPQIWTVIACVALLVVWTR